MSLYSPQCKTTQSIWSTVREEFVGQLPDLDDILPERWIIDEDTRNKISIRVDSKKVDEALIHGGYVVLYPDAIKRYWNIDVKSPTRVIFYRNWSGELQTYGDDKAYVRLRTNGKSKYLSPKGSGTGFIYWGYGLDNFRKGGSIENVFGYEGGVREKTYGAPKNWLLLEGEDKCLVANLRGYPSVALPGVTMWRASKKGHIHPWLFALGCLANLTVCFDADIFWNEKVWGQLLGIAKAWCEVLEHIRECRNAKDISLWPNLAQDWPYEDVYKRADRKHLKYTFLPPNDYYKGLDDVFQVRNWKDWLPGILENGLPCNWLDGNGDDIQWRAMVEVPRKLGLEKFKKILNVRPLDYETAQKLLQSYICIGRASCQGWSYLEGSSHVYRWNGKVWGLAELRDAKLARVLFDDCFELPHTGHIDARVSSLAHRLEFYPNSDGVHRVIGCKSYDVIVNSQNRLSPISPSNGVLSRLDYDPDGSKGRPTKTVEILKGILGSDMAVERLRCFVVNSVVYPGNVPQFGVLQGKSGRGKSTVAKILQMVLGDLLRFISWSGTVESKSAMAGYLPIELLGAGLVVEDDLKTFLSSQSVEVLNLWASNHPVYYRKMGGNPVQAVPNCSLLILMNKDLGSIIRSDDMVGLKRRMHMWEATGEPITVGQYTNIIKTVEAERPQLLAWILDCSKAEAEIGSRLDRAAVEARIDTVLSADEGIVDWVEYLGQWIDSLSLEPGRYDIITTPDAISLMTKDGAEDADYADVMAPCDLKTLAINPHSVEFWIPQVMTVILSGNNYKEVRVKSSYAISGLKNWVRANIGPSSLEKRTVTSIGNLLEEADGKGFSFQKRATFKDVKLKQHKGWRLLIP